mgnify:CR=1 FL=1
MTVTERLAGDVAVLTLDGRLVHGPDVDLLRNQVRSLLQQGHRPILMNLAGVPYMDSAGLGALVQSLATVSNSGGTLSLVSVTDRLRDLLVITKLLTVFTCYDSEDAALAANAAAR